MSKVISIATQKGGVGKTTTTLALGEALAELGERVLLIDIDPQHSLTVGCGISAHLLRKSIYDVISGKISLPEVIIEVSGKKGLHIAPSHINLSAAELELNSAIGRERKLLRHMESVADDYDFILIDCPPTLGLLTVNALAASDYIIVPVLCEFLAMRGLEIFADTVAIVKEQLNSKLEIFTFLPTMFTLRVSHMSDVLESLEQKLGDKLFPEQVRRSIKIAEAPLYGQSIVSYMEDHEGAKVYRLLASEVAKLK